MNYLSKEEKLKILRQVEEKLQQQENIIYRNLEAILNYEKDISGASSGRLKNELEELKEIKEIIASMKHKKTGLFKV